MVLRGKDAAEEQSRGRYKERHPQDGPILTEDFSNF